MRGDYIMIDLNDIKYKESWIPYTRDELIAKIEKSMSPRRFNHVLGVEKTAVELAERYDCDVNLASLAALVHDYAKERSDLVFFDLIRANERFRPLIPFGNNIWHSILGAELIRYELDVRNEEVLHAVEVHTTGAPEMSTLDKILFVADYIEPNRKFSGVKTARLLAEEDLNAAVAYELKHTLLHLIELNQPVYGLTLDAYNKWVAHVEYK